MPGMGHSGKSDQCMAGPRRPYHIASWPIDGLLQHL